MYLIYTDESGTKFLLYGGIFVHERKVNSLENKVSKIFDDFFGSAIPEIHFCDIYCYIFQRKKPCNKQKNRFLIKKYYLI